ncbi:MAG: radical SAM family heme chaperone HemW [Candidatus Dormiibacterota bacterium]
MVDAWSTADRRPHSLYVHVPFCVSKCPYCDFNSHVGLEHLFESYNQALVEEIMAWGRSLDHPRLDTIFIGGGTPSRVPAAHIKAVLDAARIAFDVAEDAEITLEANPQSAEAGRMASWLEAGVNRLSLGVQSLDSAALGFLERAHSAEEATMVFEQARVAGFANISCDLIFGIPGLSTSRWAGVLGEVLELGPDHVSAYELTPEVGTRLGAEVAAGHTLMPDEETMLAQYETVETLLRAAGFDRYEVSNWARPGRECRHNIAYWTGVPYAAAGAGAHAFLQPPALPAWLDGAGAASVRQWNVSSPAAYISAIRACGNAVAGHEQLDLATTLSDLMMMGLRRDSGVDLGDIEARWGTAARQNLSPTIARLEADGLLRTEAERVRVASAGQRVLNRVVAEFLPAGSGDLALAGYNP